MKLENHLYCRKCGRGYYCPQCGTFITGTEEELKAAKRNLKEKKKKYKKSKPSFLYEVGCFI